MMSVAMSASSSDRTKTAPTCTINHVKVSVIMADGSTTVSQIANGGTDTNIFTVSDTRSATFILNYTSAHSAGGGRISTNPGFLLGKPPDSPGTKGTGWLTDAFPSGAVLQHTTSAAYPGISNPLLHAGIFDPPGDPDGDDPMPGGLYTVNFESATFNLGASAADGVLIPGKMGFTEDAKLADPTAFAAATSGTGVFEPEFKILENSLIIYNANTGAYNLFPSDDFDFKLSLRIL